jgi:hypothetical protein
VVVAGCPRKWRNFEVELEIILFIFHGVVRGLSDSAATRERREEEGDGGGGFFLFTFLIFFFFFFDNSEKEVAVKKFVIVAVEIYAGNRGKRVDVGGWARHV